MNSVFSFNKYKKIFFHFWLLASAEKFLPYARKVIVLPKSGRGAATPPAPLARSPMSTRFASVVLQDVGEI